MAIGMMLSGILAGFAVVVFALMAGHSVLMALALYPIVGTLSAAAFLGLVMARNRDAAPQHISMSLEAAG